MVFSSLLKEYKILIFNKNVSYIWSYLLDNVYKHHTYQNIWKQNIYFANYAFIQSIFKKIFFTVFNKGPLAGNFYSIYILIDFLFGGNKFSLPLSFFFFYYYYFVLFVFFLLLLWWIKYYAFKSTLLERKPL